MNNMEAKDLLIVIATIFVPPLGVGLKVGFSGHFWLNLLLTIFGFYILGIIHGLYVVLKNIN